MDPRRLLPLAALAVAVIAVGVWVGVRDGGDERPVPQAGRASQAERATSFLARIVPPREEGSVEGSPRVPRTVGDLVRRLPLERKVAQVLLIGFRGRDLTAPIYGQLRRLDLGGIVIDRHNYGGPQLLGAMTGEAVVVARRARHVPPWVMAPQEGGEFSAFRDLPPRGAPADLVSSAQASREARRTGRTLRALGISGVLAPVVDVGLETDPALGARVFSDDPAQVAEYGEAVVSALNGQRMLSSPAHFPGLGTANQPTEEGPASVGLTLDELRRRDLRPFRAAFRAGAPAVTISHALLPLEDFTVPASLSPKVVTDLLRAEMGFRGMAITDDLVDPAITALESVPDAAVKALAAGADLLYVSGPAGDQQAAYVALLRAVRSGRVPRARLDEAVGRVLATKRRYGLIR